MFAKMYVVSGIERPDGKSRRTVGFAIGDEESIEERMGEDYDSPSLTETDVRKFPPEMEDDFERVYKVMGLTPNDGNFPELLDYAMGDEEQIRNYYHGRNHTTVTGVYKIDVQVFQP